MIENEMKNFKLVVNRHTQVPITKTVFPAGESCIRLHGNKNQTYITDKFFVNLTMDFRNNSNMFDLALIVDAVRRFYDFPLHFSLSVPYLPYARQDRVCNEGESLSLKVVADFISSLNFDKVYCDDIHSDVGKALLNNLVHTDQSNCAWKLSQYCKPENTVLVSPDAGTEKKAFDFAKKYGYDSVIRASKQRDVKSGQIKGVSIKLPDGIKGQSYLIVDDLVDGGASFIHLAQAIKEDAWYCGNKIYLYCTHGIFSKGLSVFNGYIDKIYVHNLMNDIIAENMDLYKDKLIVI